MTPDPTTPADRVEPNAYAVDDYSAIARAMKDLKCEQAQPQTKTKLWWCNNCGEANQRDEISISADGETSCKRCNCEVIDYCERCEGGGWIMTPMHPGPIFDTCPACLNPQGNQSL